MKNRFENTAMGGPCILASGTKAPACTDNFQLARFKFNGKEWQSCEQCFQASKSLDPAYSEAIRSIQPQPGHTDSAVIGRAHGKEPLAPALSVALRNAPTAGMECWSEGQKHKMSMRPDWDAVKVDIMYRVNVAKYVANPALQADLLSTGREVIDGAASTGWTSAGVAHNWSSWNGLIQMRIREEFRPEEERTPGLLQELVAKMEAYKATAGGEQLPIPADAVESNCPLQ